MTPESVLENFLQVRGHRVSPGTAECGLVREDALAAVRLAQQETRAISGGDVYLQIGGEIEPAYANWYVSSHPEESAADYRFRSWEESSHYIAHYPIPDHGTPLFVLVVAEGLAD